jgi:nucleoside-diphosphate-sugar epimerase
VFGFEPGRHTFFGIALQTLKLSNKILLDVSPFVKRDFIYIQDFAHILRRVLVHCPQGVFNLGSGCATPLGRIALGIIEGYQSGELVVTSPVERDSFELDIHRLTSCIGSMDSPMDIHSRCVEIGRKLRDA